jgi:hypothetical protein
VRRSPRLAPDAFAHRTAEHGDDGKTTKCSTCASVILRKRYKCSQCERFNLCKACYRYD